MTVNREPIPDVSGRDIPRVTASERHIRFLRARIRELEDPTWDQMIDHLRWWLDEHYPADIFVGGTGHNPGVEFVVSVRAALAQLEERLTEP